MLSIVIPVYNEAESLEALHREIREVAAANGYELDVIFVDDGSKDDSWWIIRRLAAADPQVRGIRFRRNFGKAAALSAGFALVRGEMVMTLDADLQDDPHEIPRFLAAMENNLDVVSGWKQVRHDPWHKVLPSRVFNGMVSGLTGVKLHDHNCGMKCYRREVLGEVRLYGELHRFVPVLAAGRGYRVGEIVINHRARKFGQSKYGLQPFRQRISRSADGEVPHRLRAASATRAGHGRPVVLRAGSAVGDLAGVVLDHFAAGDFRPRAGSFARKPRAVVCDRPAAGGRHNSCRSASWRNCSSPIGSRTRNLIPYRTARRRIESDQIRANRSTNEKLGPW